MNLHSSLSYNVYLPAAWLRVTGDDAAGFLQGQFTNDLRSGKPGEAVYGLWLNQKGKVLADSFIVKGAEENEFWVGSVFSTAAVVVKRLEAYVIADDVVIEDLTEAWAGVTVMGTGARAAVEPWAAGMGMVFRGRRAVEENVEWVFPRAQVDEVRARLAKVGAREISTEELARRRIAAGIPAVPADVGPGDLPNEGGLEVEAVSFTKGCYLGQEVMARLKAMGQVRRRLVRVRGTGARPETLPAGLFLGVRQVGELRSAVGDDAGGFIGMAMVSLLNLGAATEVAFEPDGASMVCVEGAR